MFDQFNDSQFQQIIFGPERKNSPKDFLFLLQVSFEFGSIIYPSRIYVIELHERKIK